MSETVEVKCKQCKEPFKARIADRRRGWGRYCSKSCKAVKQETRTGQHRKLFQSGGELSEFDREVIQQEQDLWESTGGWDEGGWLK